MADAVTTFRARDDATLPWVSLAEDKLIPMAQPVILPLKRALETIPNMSSNQPVGVRIEPGDDVRDLAAILGRLSIVEIRFPSFRDGRGYSSARILRDQMGYAGELRATGDVLIDQLVFMRRSGFDSFQFRNPVDPERIERTLARFANVYQPASDAQIPVWKRRG